MSARLFDLDDDERFVPHEGFSGAISLPLLADLIQIYTTSLASGGLTISRGGEAGKMWFEGGAIVHAVCGELIGEEAVYQLLRWHDGSFSLNQDERTVVRSITASWQQVLMEGCRRLDEEALAYGGDDGGEGVAAGQVAILDERVERILAELDHSLSGLFAVALFDAGTGALLSQRRGTVDLSAAGPSLLDLVRGQIQLRDALSQSAPFLDCLSVLGDQVHLVSSVPEERLLYLIAERSSINLAVMHRIAEQVRRSLV
jgi:hypothetical protein